MIRSVFVICMAVTSLLLSLCVQANPSGIQFDGFPNFDSTLRAVTPEFEEQYNIPVGTRIRDYATHHRQLIKALIKGSGAGDVILVDVEKIASLISRGGLLNLSRKFGADSLEENFPPYAWAQARGADGDMYAIPMDLGPGVMYYRRDLFEKAGIDVDDAIKDWESYVAAGERLKPLGIHLIASADDVAHIMIVTTVPEGESTYFDQNGEPTVTSERFVRAFQVAKSIRDKGLDANMHTLAWNSEWYRGFRKGTFATQLSGSWFLGHLQNWIAPETAGLWRVSHLPEGIYGSWGGSFLVIPTQSDKQEEGWRFINYLALGGKNQLTHLSVTGGFPANQATYGSESFDRGIGFLGGQKARGIFAEVVRNIKPVSLYEGDHIARSIIINDALLAVLDGKKEVGEALAEADALIRRRTKRLRR